MQGWFNDKCVSCHDPEGFHASGEFNWQDYQNVKNHLNDGSDGRAGILTRVNNKSMPPAGEPALSQSDIDRLNKWASCGAPE